jgi:hypothetical protein
MEVFNFENLTWPKFGVGWSISSVLLLYLLLFISQLGLEVGGVAPVVSPSHNGSALEHATASTRAHCNSTCTERSAFIHRPELGGRQLGLVCRSCLLRTHHHPRHRRRGVRSSLSETSQTEVYAWTHPSPVLRSVQPLRRVRCRLLIHVGFGTG